MTLNSPTPQPMRFSTPDDTEELARAEAYGVLALLFVAAPSPEFHAQLRMAPTEAPSAGGFLEASFSELVAAARRLSTAAIADEYDALFQAL
ncbi:MAG: hypothetical protein JWP52_4456, partial [Rhizobacter sp.]|nr:hypothetical protein [Rhizobacter sp.]